MELQLNKQAKILLQHHNAQLLDQFQSVLLSRQHFNSCIMVLHQSQQYLFVTANVLIAQLRNHTFFHQQTQHCRQTALSLLLHQCMQGLQQGIGHGQLLQLGAWVVMEMMFSSSQHTNCLFNTINLLLPTFQPHQNILDDSHFNQAHMQAAPSTRQYILCTGLLVRVLDCVLETNKGEFKGFMKKLRWFVDTYLEHFVMYVLHYAKIYFNLWLGEQNEYHAVLKVTVQLLDRVITFPVVPSYNEFQFQSNLDKVAPDPCIRFPEYYHKLIYDTHFTHTLTNYTLYLIHHTDLQNFHLSPTKPTIISILRIFGRIFNMEKHRVLSNLQEKVLEEHYIGVAIQLAREFKFYDEYYLCCLFDLFDRVVVYGMNLCGHDLIAEFHFAMAEFANKVIGLASTMLSEGDFALSKRCFQLLQYCRRKTCGEENQVLLRISYQNIFEAFIETITLQSSLHRTMNQLYSVEDESNGFEELANKISSFYFSFSDRNNTIVFSMKLDDNCHPQIRSFWFYFISCLFVKAERGQNQQEVAIILKFVDISKKENIPACILFLRKLVTECMARAVANKKNYENTTPLWLGIKKATNQSFNNFLQLVVEKFISSLTFPKEKTISASLEALNRLKRHLFKGLNFFPEKTFSMIQCYSENIHETPLKDERLGQLRNDFYSLVSQIWLNSFNIEHILRIYQTIKKQMNAHNLTISAIQCFANFLNDFSGLLNGLNSTERNSLLEISMPDLQFYLKKLLTEERIKIFFNDYRFHEAFIKFVSSLCTAQKSIKGMCTHVKISVVIHELLYPYLKVLVQCEPSYHLAKIWLFMAQMNPIAPLLPLKPQLNINHSSNLMEKSVAQDVFCFDSLLNFYFQSLHRVEEFQEMLSYTDGKVELIKNWWEHAIGEDILPKNIQLAEYAEKTVREIRMKVPADLRRKLQGFAHLLYDIERTFPTLGTLGLPRTSLKDYTRAFVKVAWNK